MISKIDHEVIQRFLETSNFVKIISSWELSEPSGEKTKMFQIAMILGKIKKDTLQLHKYVDTQSFRDWLKKLESKEILEEYDEFIEKNYPILLL